MERIPRLGQMAVLAVVWVFSSAAFGVQVFENFDTDPGWDGDNNFAGLPPNQVDQDYGFSPTQFAGGAQSGEIGGQFFRSIEPSYYGKILSATKTLEDPLTCSGRFRVTQSTGGGAMLFGWFNHQARGFRPNGWIGLRLDGESGKYRVLVEYGNELNQAGGDRLRDDLGNDLFNVGPTPLDFTFTYNPAGNGGNGQMTFTLEPLFTETFVFNLGSGHKAAGATFDRFGFINQQVPGGRINVFYDDLVIDGTPENFDSDPMWEELGNRDSFLDYGTQDNHQFGYMLSDHAGGGAGEVGGRIWRTDENHPERAAYYGAVVDSLNLQKRLTASGKVAMTEGVADSGALFGWFNSEERDIPVKNFVGVFLEGPSRVGHYFRPVYGTQMAGVGGDSQSGPVIRPDGSVHDWTIEYDPNGASGNGLMTVTLDSETKTFPLQSGHKAIDADLNRFGLANLEVGGKHASFFFDDLEYTVSVPEDETPFTPTVTPTGTTTLLATLTQTLTSTPTQTETPALPDCDVDDDGDCDAIDVLQILRDRFGNPPDIDTDFDGLGGEDGKDLFEIALKWPTLIR